MAEYKVQFEVFEGPLDLLLYLIKKEEVDIYEVNLTKLATQFIEYIDLMRVFDLEVAGDFILLHDFHFGQHNRVLDRWIALYGKFFLGATQLKAFEALPPDEKQRSAFLSQNVRVKIQVLWYFGPSGKSG